MQCYAYNVDLPNCLIAPQQRFTFEPVLMQYKEGGAEVIPWELPHKA